ncbi:vWA domain-containing protein [Haloarchaeobius iranensis]|uniref:von Willebrand factor type A domain-containing protein n=1 Tax=Haloarchaeobius iranensis TaxID=996166 RepID=A0A1G9TSL5_9EURY|nr:vWA domain-containing protein [Haloarchaeobius iranensis]SDM50652.1 von Willebrand factor type A domain-containing protein [Haloarchaeobius iranensis]
MTTDKQHNISRRTVLAGLGTVGIAAAGAGLGTTALFSDREGFIGNSLGAGSLDLKLDYEATYLGGAGRLDDIVAMGYPDAEDLGGGRYLLDQAPRPGEGQGWDDYVTGEGFDFCAPENDEFLVNGDEMPVFTLSDIKPGDCGEVTISFHICDNPAWLDLSGSVYDNNENGRTEPERAVDETGGNPGLGMGELADLIEVCVWYDEDCDNVYEPGGEGEGQELEVALVSDVSGSMNGSKIAALRNAATDFVDNLAQPDEVAAISFNSGSNLDQALTTNYQAVKDAINNYSSGGTTNMSSGIITGDNELTSGANATPSASKVMIVLTDGVVNSPPSAEQAATDAKNNGIRIFTIALGGDADQTFLENDIASNPGDAFLAPDAADLDTIYEEIAQIVLEGEQKVLSGTMAEVFVELAEGVPLDGDRTSEERDPYAAVTTQCIGFEWCLPAEVGNEVQTDSVSFDLVVDAEQSRHNDNPGGENNSSDGGNSTPPTTTAAN